MNTQWIYINNCSVVAEMRDRVQFRCNENNKMFTVKFVNMHPNMSRIGPFFDGVVILDKFYAPKWSYE